MDTLEKKEDIDLFVKKDSTFGIVAAILVFVFLIIFAFIHFNETKELLLLVKGADPIWLGLAIVTDILTYILAGNVWHLVAKSAQYHIPFRSLVELAVEELSINQLIPAGGVAGHLIILRAMKRLGLPKSLTIEILFIGLLAYYVAFATVTFISLIILFLHNHITPIILILVCVSLMIQLTLTAVIFAIVNHRKLSIPKWAKKLKLISYLLGYVEQVSPERVFSLAILAKTSLLRLGIFIFDSATLFLVMQAIGIHHTFLTAFVAITMASVSGAVILIPGVIGGFEAGCIATLILLGIPADGAIVATLLFRGVSLWIPLVPGLILARKDLGLVKTN